MGENIKMNGTVENEAKAILMGIKIKIDKNPLLREVYYKGNKNFDGLIDKYNGEKVLMAVQLVESYKLLLEMDEVYSD